jgi:hypothetical protein
MYGSYVTFRLANSPFAASIPPFTPQQKPTVPILPFAD